MATNTSRFGLVKPDDAENYDLSVWNGNSDKVAAQLGFKPATLATFPAAPEAGETVMATDDGNSLWVSNGSIPASGSWMEIHKEPTVTPIGGIVSAIKTVNQVIQSQTTLQDDNALAFTNLPPSSSWALDSTLYYATADNADLKIGWSGTNVSVLYWTPGGLDSGATTVIGAVTKSWISSISTTATLGGGGGFASATPSGTLVIGATTPGTLQFRWAQETSQASNTQIATLSWIRLTRIT